jgi:hypothetical protein
MNCEGSRTRGTGSSNPLSSSRESHTNLENEIDIPVPRTHRTLMTSGYHQTDAEMSKLPGVTATPPTEEAWRFLSILELLEPGKGYDDLKKHLHIGRLIGGKVWLLDPVLTTIGAVILAAALGGLAWSWWTYQAVTLLTVGSLGLLDTIPCA